jgi:hypothetical protein
MEISVENDGVGHENLFTSPRGEHIKETGGEAFQGARGVRLSWFPHTLSFIE